MCALDYRHGLLLLIAACFVLSSPTRGQSAPGTASRAAAIPRTTIKVDVDLVDVFFNVRDGKGRLVANEREDHFDLFEDGVPQHIKYFSAEPDRPLSIALLLDTSNSQEQVLNTERKAAHRFLRQLLTPDDQLLIASFNTLVQLNFDFTQDFRVVSHVLSRILVTNANEPRARSQERQGTALYDALDVIARTRLFDAVGRKAMVIVTDGQDNFSRISIQEAIDSALRAEASCYVLLVADPSWTSSKNYQYDGRNRMAKMVADTGGRVIPVGDRMQRLQASFNEIAAELRRQYVIGYIPSNKPRDAKFRNIEVRSKHGYRVQHRAGYYARVPNPVAPEIGP